MTIGFCLFLALLIGLAGGFFLCCALTDDISGTTKTIVIFGPVEKLSQKE